MKKRKCAKPSQFHERWLKAYGVRVTARDAATGNVCSVECQFCRAFGKEGRHDRIRAPRSNIKMFSKPWRPDHMKTHMVEQHQQRFEEYAALPPGEKASYFVTCAGGKPEVSNFFRPAITNDSTVNVWIDRSIVEGIIGNMLFDPDDDDSLTKERFLSVFKLQEQPSETNVEGGAGEGDRDTGVENYVATVSSKMQFYSCIKMVASGLSFRQASRVMQDMKETLGLSALGSMCPQKVSSFVRIVCASNLQTISAILKESWAFSIALDGGNKSDTSYLDVRIRVVSSCGVLSNLHLLAIPMRDRHTGEHMYDLASTALDNLAPDWRNRIISVTTDGASSMTGQYRGVASRFGNAALPGFYRVWCALHQLDLVLQRLYNSLCDDSFVGTVTSMTGHLRRQFNLIAEMGSKCPRFVNTRWMSMSKVIKWFVANRVDIIAHLATKTVNWAPTDAWWIVTCCLNRVMKVVDATIVSLQGKQLQVSAQRQILEGLIVDLCKLGGAVLGPLSLDEIARLQTNDGIDRLMTPLSPPNDSLQDPNVTSRVREWHVHKGKFAMKLDDAHKFVENCGSFAMERLQEMSASSDGANLLTYTQVLNSVAHMFVDLVSGIDSIQAERDASNNSSDYMLPPATPSQLAAVSNRDFSILIQQQRERLLHTWQSAEIDTLEELFNDLKLLLAQDARIRAIVESEKHSSSFAEAWAPFDKQFAPLKQFFGGLATVFPGTATVESDFSLINWEKGDYRSSLTDFSLEGILHSKQYFELLGIATNMND
ncbi:hypothetical protein MHU86_19764 [Fragilaria crotonensis]|nr:hypothetical protein MHU86_19764 [Fragilaria crotonensis]